MTETFEARAEALAAAAIEGARAAGARFAEARVVRRQRETLDVRDAKLDGIKHRDDLGLGVRALFDDGWGYAGTNVLTPEACRDAGADAVRAGRAVARTARVEVDVPPAVEGRYVTPMERDPLEVPLAEKIALIADAHGVMAQVPGVTTRRGRVMSQRTDTLLLASQGTRTVQAVTLVGAGIEAMAMRGGTFQRRSAPKSGEGNLLQGGFEHVLAMNLGDEARRLAGEAVALLDADPMPTGETTVILAGSQLSLQIHESVGHPIELDRVFGEEISLAGGSFLQPPALDTLRFGSSLVNLTADATTPLGPGTFGFDDEGTPATSTPIVRDGTLVGFLSGRDTAARLDRPSSSAMRAETWAAQPIVRMINVNLEPGEGSLDDLIGGVDDGVLLDQNTSWSIDDLRLNFQFGCEIGYEIKGGRLTGRIFRNPLYTGVTPRFWGRCSAIAGPEAWKMWGYLYCGKGDPVQVMYVGHGCAPARFDGVSVGSSK